MWLAKLTTILKRVVTDHVSQPYSTTLNIIVSCILIRNIISWDYIILYLISPEVFNFFKCWSLYLVLKKRDHYDFPSVNKSHRVDDLIWTLNVVFNVFLRNLPRFDWEAENWGVNSCNKMKKTCMQSLFSNPLSWDWLQTYF